MKVLISAPGSSLGRVLADGLTEQHQVVLADSGDGLLCVAPLWSTASAVVSDMIVILRVLGWPVNALFDNGRQMLIYGEAVANFTRRIRRSGVVHVRTTAKRNTLLPK